MFLIECIMVSTSDTNFHGSGEVFVMLNTAPSMYGSGSWATISQDGTRSYQFDPAFNHVPLNIEITINDDEDSQLNSLYDSKFYYNITSISNDLFDPANVLSEGK